MQPHIVIMAGLDALSKDIIQNWIGPLFLVGIAAFALVFIKDRAWMKLIGFVGIAAVVGVLIYGGSTLFGGEDKGLTGQAKKIGTQVGQ